MEKMQNARALRAEELFCSGLNCAQAVFVVLSEDAGLDQKTALTISSSFGGGMGRLREVCGAVSGMFMAAGLWYGGYAPSDREAKRRHYAIIQELARRFERENGSIICRELLGLSEKRQKPLPDARTPEYFKKRPCAELVRMAVEIFDDFTADYDAGKIEL